MLISNLPMMEMVRVMLIDTDIGHSVKMLVWVVKGDEDYMDYKTVVFPLCLN